jgi:hypothetical protein
MGPDLTTQQNYVDRTVFAIDETKVNCPKGSKIVDRVILIILIDNIY